MDVADTDIYTHEHTLSLHGAPPTFAADSHEDAAERHLHVRRARVSLFLGRDRGFTDEEADAVLASPQGRQIAEMMRYSSVVTPDRVRDGLEEFRSPPSAYELIVVHSSPTLASSLLPVPLLAQARLLPPACVGSTPPPP